jgi:hypothetical protein
VPSEGQEEFVMVGLGEPENTVIPQPGLGTTHITVAETENAGPQSRLSGPLGRYVSGEALTHEQLELLGKEILNDEDPRVRIALSQILRERGVELPAPGNPTENGRLLSEEEMRARAKPVVRAHFDQQRIGSPEQADHTTDIAIQAALNGTPGGEGGGRVPGRGSSPSQTPTWSKAAIVVGVVVVAIVLCVFRGKKIPAAMRSSVSTIVEVFNRIVSKSPGTRL